MNDIIKQIEGHIDQSLKDILEQVIENASTRLQDNDYKDLVSEFTYYYSSQLKKESFPAIKRIVIPSNGANNASGSKAQQRVVIIGDIHSDFNSLSSILRKLAASSYDYLSKSIIIFCGDYCDRGRRPFETLRLLYALKTYMGERCILLKGNHEIIKYSCSMLRPTFFPADTAVLMNRVLTPEVNNLYYNYISRLPYFVSLTYQGKKYLICHGSIPRHDYAEYFNEDKLLEMVLPESDQSNEGIMLSQMLWGDPGDNSSVFRGTEIRFEFSKNEFLEFMNKHGYEIMIRGHQPVDKGVMLCYNNKLISLFSSGGHGNIDSSYPDDVGSPSFLVLTEDGKMMFEKVYGKTGKKW